jgi:hypothetical protein
MAKYKFSSETVIHVDGKPFWPLDDATGFVTMRDSHGSIFKMVREDGTEGLPAIEEFDRMVEDGRARVSEIAKRSKALDIRDTAEWDAAECSDLDPKSAFRLFVCILLDRVGAKNGEKDIDLKLDAHWTAEIEADHGPGQSRQQ